MFNLNLLQKNLTVVEYEKLNLSTGSYIPEWQSLPSYIFAQCPYCSAKNVEKLNTYEIEGWQYSLSRVSSLAIFSPQLVVHHCKHFTLTQVFFRYYETLPCQLRGFIRQDNLYVIGHLLETGQCLAVIHALPICSIERNEFVPRYTLFIISYFSEQPEEAIKDIHQYNADWYSWEASNTLFLPLQFGDEQWADLNHWVSIRKLFWIDSTNPELEIYTGDPENFPYGNIADLSVKITRRVCIHNHSERDLQLRTDLSTEIIKLRSHDIHTFDLLDELSDAKPKIEITTEHLTISFLEQSVRQRHSDKWIEAFELVNRSNSQIELLLQPIGQNLKVRKGDIIQIWGHPKDILDREGEDIKWEKRSKNVYIGIAPFTRFTIFQNGEKVIQKD